MQLQKPTLRNTDHTKREADQRSRLDIVHGNSARRTDLTALDRGQQITPCVGNQINEEYKLDREVDQTEDAIYNNDLKDITDVVMQMTADLRGNK